VLFHPVTTEVDLFEQYANEFVDSLIESNQNYIVVYPNNDEGSEYIFKAYEKLKGPKFKKFPSISFERFLVLLENSKFIIGNSSAGIREAPYYGLPCINVGTRQDNRYLSEGILSSGYSKNEIISAINNIENIPELHNDGYFGGGNSSKLFMDFLESEETWELSKQKTFMDIKIKVSIPHLNRSVYV